MTATPTHEPAKPHGTEHKAAAKAPPPHPLEAEGSKLVEEVKEAAKKHKDVVTGLREKHAEFLAKQPADLTFRAAHSVSAIATQVEELINMLDPACYVKEPAPLVEPEPEPEARKHA
jgi:hypothetical protein